jgi:non-specific protein-tyrosine kinase
MTGADVVRAIRARWLLFIVCCIVPIAAAAFAAHRAPAPVYSATAGLLVEPTILAEGVDAYQNAASAAQLAQQQAPSYASLVDSPAVLQAVIADLHLATTPSGLSRQVSATSPVNSVVINITASGESAAAARDIANDTAQRFVGLVEGISGSIVGHALASPPVAGPSVEQRVVRPQLRLSLVKPALLPTAPKSSHKTIDLFLGLVVGLVVGLTAVILREKTDLRVRTVGQARSSTGCSFATSAGDIRGRAGSAAESFRRLRLRLVRALSSHPAKSLAVTSLAPGDCGPVVAIHLALVLAEAGSSVLLVDADARAGQIARHFGMDGRLGLTTAIGDETLPEQAFQQYHENLRILLAAGAEQPSPAELAQLLDTWQGTSDYIVVHAGPILAHAVAAELSATAHTVLLVAQRDKARQKDLRLASEMLCNANADLLGVVLAPAHLAVRPSQYRTGRPGPSSRLAAACNGQGIVAPADLIQRASGSRPGPGSPEREQ